jgi:hypothetical protein
MPGGTIIVGRTNARLEVVDPELGRYIESDAQGDPSSGE